MGTLAEFEQLVKDCLKKAEQNYGVDTSIVEIHLTLKGTMAGQACARFMKATGNRRRFQLYFNPEAIKLDWNHMTKSTIPHEVAHMVGYLAYYRGSKARGPLCLFANPAKISAHNEHWRQCAMELGDIDSMNRCHSLPLQRSRKLTRHLYRIPVSNEEFKVTQIIHNKILRGQRRRSLRTGLLLTRDHYVGPVE